MGKEKTNQSMRINFVDEYPRERVTGILKYKMYRHIGDKKILIEEEDWHNLIVDLARIQMAHLVAGDFDGREIVKIAFGTSGTAPTVSDTTITNVLLKDIDDFEYPEPGQVQFNWGLTVSEGNGMAITEFGLITADGKLFSRRNREKPINKESDISLEGSWTIIF
jgi:hypothetical protein